MTSLQAELASLRAENMELKNNVTVCVVRMGELHKQVTLLRNLLARYRNETPVGHQPHMICHEVDEVLAATAPKEFT